MEEKRKRGRPPKPKPDIKLEPKKMGRPKLDNSRDRSLPLVRINEQELAAFKQAASLAGVPFAEWVRSVLNAAARTAYKL